MSRRYRLRRPRTTAERRAIEAARVDRLPYRARRRGIPTHRDDIVVGKSKREKRRPWRER